MGSVNMAKKRLTGMDEEGVSPVIGVVKLMEYVYW